MKNLILVLLIMTSINSANARCIPGETATVTWAGGDDRDGYKFRSYTTGTERVLPVGTRITVVTAQYDNKGAGTTLLGLEVLASGRARNLIDPTSGEALSCEPIQKEQGKFIPPAGFFGVEFVSCY